MRVLWLSNKILQEKDIGTTGSWLEPMAQALVRSGEIELGNITAGKVNSLTRHDYGAIKQWLVPVRRLGRHGLPSHDVVADIVKVVVEFRPDLVHIWGTEAYWGLLTARGIIRLPALLEIQGLKGAIARVFEGGLNVREQMACIGLKEIVRGTTTFQVKKQFGRWGAFEREMIQSHRFIFTQSEWVRAHVAALNRSSTIFHTARILRKQFYIASVWKPIYSKRIFFSAAYAAPFKGLHTALNALAILKQRFTNIQLRIAGAIQKVGIRQDGYVQWLNRLVRKLDIDKNVKWLGALSADGVVSEISSCAAMVIPSFIESYSMTMQEAMYLGVPVVASYVGGLPSLAKDEESALFFPAGDAEMCAYQLERLLIDPGLAERIGKRAREEVLFRNEPERIVRNQIEIYRQVLALSSERH